MQAHEFTKMLIRNRGTFSHMLKEALKENLEIKNDEGSIRILYDGEDITETVMEK